MGRMNDLIAATAATAATAAGAVKKKIYRAGRAPKLNFYKDAAGEWRYRVIAANGELVVASEGYTRRTDARRGFEDMARNIAKLTPPPRSVDE